LIHASSAWQQATGQNVGVFVLDSGVDDHNLDLQTLPVLRAVQNGGGGRPNMVALG
jgi:hypothetical protein